VPASDGAQRVEDRQRRGTALPAHDGCLDVADRGALGQRCHGDLIWADEDVQGVGDGDAAAGGDVGLRLDRLVTVAGRRDPRADVGAAQHVVDEPCGGSVVRADPGVLSELVSPDRGPAGEAVAGGQQDARGVGEQRDELDVLGGRFGLELVLEDVVPGSRPLLIVLLPSVAAGRRW
jgi:hypothetical protein